MSITGLVAVNCLRALYLGSIRNGVVAGVSADSSTTDGVTVLDCQDVVVSDASVTTCGRVSLRLTSAAGSATARVEVRGVRIRNAGNGGEAAHAFGVHHIHGADVTFDGLTVTADNGLLQYGYFMASATATDQQTTALRNVNLSGDTGTSRFRSTVTTVKEWAGVRLSGSVLYKPSGQTATVTVP